MSTFEFYFAGGLKMKCLSLLNIFNKEVAWLKINKWAFNLFWERSSNLYMSQKPKI